MRAHRATGRLVMGSQIIGHSNGEAQLYQLVSSFLQWSLLWWKHRCARWGQSLSPIHSLLFMENHSNPPSSSGVSELGSHSLCILTKCPILVLSYLFLPFSSCTVVSVNILDANFVLASATTVFIGKEEQSLDLTSSYNIWERALMVCPSRPITYTFIISGIGNSWEILFGNISVGSLI